MTEDYCEENLITRTETYLNEVVAQSLEKSVQVLCSCESLLLIAEELGILNRCVNACKEQLVSGLSRLDCDGSSVGLKGGCLGNTRQPSAPGKGFVYSAESTLAAFLNPSSSKLVSVEASEETWKRLSNFFSRAWDEKGIWGFKPKNQNEDYLTWFYRKRDLGL